MNYLGLMSSRVSVYCLFAFWLFRFSFDTYAQTPDRLFVPDQIIVTEGIYTLQGTPRKGFEIIIQGESKRLLKDLVSELKESYNAKAKMKGGKLFAEQQLVSALSDKHFNLTAATEEKQDGTHLVIWMSFGTDIYVSSSDYSLEATNIKGFLKGFAKNFYTSFFHDRVSEMTKEVGSLSKSIDKDQKSLSKLDRKKIKLESNKEKEESKREKLQSKLVKIKSDIESSEHETKTLSEKVEIINMEIDTDRLKLNTRRDNLKLRNDELESLKQQILKIQNL